MRLVEDGAIGLDEDIRPRLKTWRFPAEFEPGPGGVTLRGLLSHSAGLSDQILTGYGPDEALPSLAQVLSGDKPAKNGPLWVPPRMSVRLRAWLSEAGYVVVQQLLEDLTGRPFPELVAERIFKPLGLTHSVFGSGFGGDLRPEAAVGFLREGKAVPGGAARFPEDAAKGLWTTPSEYAAIVLDVLAAAEDRPARILPPAAARRLLAAQVENFGFGFFVEGRGDALLFRASGTTHGFAGALVLYPAKGQGAVIMSNSDNGDVLIEEILTGFSAAYDWPDFKPLEKPVLRLSPEAYAGLRRPLRSRARLRPRHPSRGLLPGDHADRSGADPVLRRGPDAVLLDRSVYPHPVLSRDRRYRGQPGPVAEGLPAGGPQGLLNRTQRPAFFKAWGMPSVFLAASISLTVRGMPAVRFSQPVSVIRTVSSTRTPDLLGRQDK